MQKEIETIAEQIHNQCRTQILCQCRCNRRRDRQEELFLQYAIRKATKEKTDQRQQESIQSEECPRTEILHETKRKADQRSPCAAAQKGEGDGCQNEEIGNHTVDGNKRKEGKLQDKENEEKQDKKPIFLHCAAAFVCAAEICAAASAPGLSGAG